MWPAVPGAALDSMKPVRPSVLCLFCSVLKWTPSKELGGMGVQTESPDPALSELDLLMRLWLPSGS